MDCVCYRYGKTLTNLAKHTDIQYVQDEKAVQKLVNDPRFRQLTELTDSLTEIEVAKKKINWNLPSAIGFFVYQYAKLRMLDFHYKVIDHFVSRSDYQLVEMDTDSLYMALSAPTLEEAVKPQLKEEFYNIYHNWFPSPHCDRHQRAYVRGKLQGDWTPRPCCEKRRKYDKRTPGLFKLEFKGQNIVALCSKTYICTGQDETKLTCKGLNKARNQLTEDQYLDVLRHRESGGGENCGFRMSGAVMTTYLQQRRSLSYLYIKRRVCEDGVSTLPILI